MSRTTASVVWFALAAAQSLESSAQSITTLVLAGDVVAGFGEVVAIEGVAVNNAGEWIVEVGVDSALTHLDGALIKNGALFLKEGQALAEPVGSSIAFFDGVNLNGTGNSGLKFLLAGTSGTSDDSGIYFDDSLVIQEGFISTAAGLNPGTSYGGFFKSLINDNGQILILAGVVDPAAPLDPYQAAVAVQVDGTGTLLSETLLAKKGDILPGQTNAVFWLGYGPHATDFNNAGSALFIVTLSATSAVNGCVYLDGTLLAQEGSPSPVAGRNWKTLSSGDDCVSLSDTGHWVHTGRLDGTSNDNSVIVRDGALFRQTGQSMPAIAPYVIVSFGGVTPVDIDDAGNVLWFCSWDDPDLSKNEGLFLNDTLLVREGVTQIEGKRVESLPGTYETFELSPDGRWVIFEATLEGGFNGAFLIDLAPGCPTPATYCTVKPTSIAGCLPSFTTLGTPSASAGSGFLIQCGPVPGANVGLYLYTTNGAAAAPINNAFGWLCLQTGPGLFRTPGTGAGGTSGVCNGSYDIDFNQYFATQVVDPNLVAGASVDTQVWYRDPPNPGTANFSGALQFLMCP